MNQYTSNNFNVNSGGFIMSFKTITIRKETYEKLKALKGENQSFSDVIEDLIKQKRSLLDFFGAWETDDEEVEKIEKILAEGWNKWNKNTDV